MNCLSQRFCSILPRERILSDVLMSENTTMHVGGPADLFVSPRCIDEIVDIVQICRSEGIPFIVIGNGSNVVFSDTGYRGVVLHLGKAFSDITFDGQILEAKAGAMLSSLSHLAASRSLTGLEFASGIPGSVGGAVFMNAGAYGGEIAQIAEKTTVLSEDGTVRELSNSEMCFSYRSSTAMKSGMTILSSIFRLNPGEKEQI
ncbi:MAG: FAD-binding protein, partial [Oscillospiraceae bacterium]|nr:FAD-binding protein [Oscillospiraceae bacterium]